MSDTHNQIMNIPARGTDVEASLRRAGFDDVVFSDKIMLAYRVGHRDARHAAAEISLTASRSAFRRCLIVTQGTDQGWSDEQIDEALEVKP